MTDKNYLTDIIHKNLGINYLTKFNLNPSKELTADYLQSLPAKILPKNIDQQQIETSANIIKNAYLEDNKSVDLGESDLEIFDNRVVSTVCGLETALLYVSNNLPIGEMKTFISKVNSNNDKFETKYLDAAFSDFEKISTLIENSDFNSIENLSEIKNTIRTSYLNVLKSAGLEDKYNIFKTILPGIDEKLVFNRMFDKNVLDYMSQLKDSNIFNEENDSYKLRDSIETFTEDARETALKYDVKLNDVDNSLLEFLELAGEFNVYKNTSGEKPTEDLVSQYKRVSETLNKVDTLKNNGLFSETAVYLKQAVYDVMDNAMPGRK